MTNTLTIRAPDDFHVHLRHGDLLRAVLGHTVRVFHRALIMPNLKGRPVTNGDRMREYAAEVMHVKACLEVFRPFEPLMTIQITDETTPEMVDLAYAAGAVAGKVYPVDVTTNSGNGMSDFGGPQFSSVLAAMERLRMVLCVHGEVPMAPVLDAERRFLPGLRVMAERFPSLRIVFEHISSAAAVLAVRELPDTVAATITAHHLVLEFPRVMGAKMHPHHFCKPVAKWAADRHALIEAATSGNPKFFFGSDSAPHPRRDKECSDCAAGCFTAPIALPLLADVFAECGALHRLADFTSTFGAKFYGLALNDGTVTLVREPMRVPETVPIPNTDDVIVPFHAGRELAWSVCDPVV